MTRFQDGDSVVPLAAGLVGAAALHAENGWWLNSGKGVAGTVVMLFSLGLIFGCRRSGSRRTLGTALWLGAMIELTATLSWIGPGTLWPIVLVVSGIITAGLTIAGNLTGMWLSEAYEARGFRERAVPAVHPSGSDPSHNVSKLGNTAPSR